MVRDMERRLRQHEWKAHLFKRMKANYESAGEQNMDREEDKLAEIERQDVDNSV